MNYKKNIKVFGITELVTENDFFDYEAKYEGKSEEITPARISGAEKEKVGRLATKVYQVLNMKGFSRSEFIIVDGEPHFLEINTVPGMTMESLLPQQAKEASISLTDLFDNAIQMALN
jgi:D-alanine-D-alanine ligase